MAYYDYSIAVGHNNAAGLINVESLIASAIGRPLAIPPRGVPVPDGSVRRTTLTGKQYAAGAKIITWSWNVIPQAGFASLINTFLGDFDTTSANVTIRTRKRDDTFSNYNAVMILPRIGQDYERGAGGNLLNLNIQFSHLEAL